MKRFLTVIIGAMLALACAAPGETFRDGETVCFLGDSISHGGRFHSYVYDYYLTRFPERTIRFVNAGVSGDSARGAMGRLAEDVIDKRPSAVVVMLGMNDVGCGNYVADPDAAKKAAQESALENYRRSMDALLARIRAELDPRILAITPSPFDQTAVNDRNNNQPGCNDGLARCAAAVRELAAKHRGEVVDFHRPMTALNLERQKSDPAFTLIGPDRVHPGPPGHLMMAWLFLKAQGAPSRVSLVAFDAAAGRAIEAENARVRDAVRTADGASFTVMAGALPFPIEDAARPVLALAPIERDLNQEILKVTNLSRGTYELAIDGTAVAKHTAAEWAAGINLALNGATPQARQAQTVAKLNEARRSAEVVLRNHAAVRGFLRSRKVDPDDLAAAATFAESQTNKTGYFESKIPDYVKTWGRRAEAVAKVEDLGGQALAARKPEPRVYVIRRIP